MLLVYTLVLVLLGLVRWLVGRRAVWLERKLAKLAAAVLKLGHEPLHKQGNRNYVEAFTLAKRQYALGRLVTDRDRAEAKFLRWQTWSDALAGALGRLRDWKGKKLPYTLGALDVWLVLYLVDYFGLAQFVSARKLMEALTAWWSG